MSLKHRIYFNSIAPEWNCIKAEEKAPFREYCIQFGVASGDRILDIGAGTGRLSQILTELVGSNGLVVAEDFASTMIEEGKKYLKTNNLVWLCDDVAYLALKNETFNKIICFSVFPHFSDQKQALKEMTRILRPGGKILVLHTSNSQALNLFHASLNEVVSRDRLPPKEEMISLFEKRGLMVLKAIEREDLYWVEGLKC